MRGDFSTFRHSLLDWFHRERRRLPWRENPSLYKTVVSEFMLQQTQVDTVLPYFDAWMRDFPGFEELAAASEEAVLKAWEGLGYYTRARNLHRLARSISLQGVPQSAEEWRDRPGIGPYTAAAVASIAQGCPEPVIDGNVIRVLCRLENDRQPIRSAEEGRRRLLPLARQLIDHDRPGDFNEAMMELGATVCRKARPACLLCPVRPHCRASAAGSETALPIILRKQTRTRQVDRLFLLAEGRILLHFYPADARRLAGLAELPAISAPTGQKPILSRTRGISTERIRESIYALDASHPQALACLAADHCRWVPVGELTGASLSAPHRRWIQALLERPDIY